MRDSEAIREATKAFTQSLYKGSKYSEKMVEAFSKSFEEHINAAIQQYEQLKRRR